MRQQLDEALAAAARVAAEMRADAAWAERFVADAPTDVWVTGLGMDGAGIRLQQRVPTGTQQAVASELRRRLSAAFVAAVDRDGTLGHAAADREPVRGVLRAPGAGRSRLEVGAVARGGHSL